MQLPLLIIYTLNALLMLVSVVGLRLKSNERLYSLALIQVLLGLPLLAGAYLYLTYFFTLRLLQAVLFSEVSFSLIWLTMALRLRRATSSPAMKSRSGLAAELFATLSATAAAGCFFYFYAEFEAIAGCPVFKNWSPAYISAFYILFVVLYVSWRLEQFWNGLTPVQRWAYKTLVTSNMLLCGTFAWMASYRLTYLEIVPHHLLLAAILLLLAWALMLYGVLHHRLLNRKFFVSRKIVSTLAIPSLLAAYLIGFSLFSLLMHTFGLEMGFVVRWLLVTAGVVAALLLTFSGRVRRRIHFYISTNFYVNKYEYRDEWQALSQQLQGASTERQVVMALRQVLTDSLYTTRIFIWLADGNKGCRLVSAPENHPTGHNDDGLAADNPLLPFLRSHSYFHIDNADPDSAWHRVRGDAEPFLSSMGLALLTPISVGEQLLGVIGLGAEYTGGQYGRDDFDLLTVLGSQTATALLAVHMAEELAHAREQQAWNRLSAFVLHDIKNATTMLSMLRENAPEHIHEPEFQQDMLELVDDALRRMGRVERRLLTLKDEIIPVLREIELCSTLQAGCRRLRNKLPGMEIRVEFTDKIKLHTDPELLFSVLENLLLNAFQARGEGNSVLLKIYKTADGQVRMELTDKGPGIAEELLPHALFEPFKTMKKNGSGIGLWQAKRMVFSLGGDISAMNSPGGGARFVVILPLI
ncbi:ATP-binding protein [Desulfobacterota bacterium M19]